MCLPPMLIAALAAQAASSYANKRANDAVLAKQNQVAQAERTRQAEFQKRAQGTFESTLSKFDKPAQEQAVADAATQRDAALTNTQAQAPADYTPTDNSAPAVVKADIASRFADALRRGKTEVAARAKLGAYGQNQNTNAINLGRSGQDINQMANFSSGSANVVPYEMQASLNAGKHWRDMGDMMRLAGTGMSMYGMMSAPPLNYATSPSMVADNGMTYTDPNDLVQARKLGVIR